MRRALCQPALRGWAPADARTVSRRAAARSPQPPPSCSLQGLYPTAAAQRRERRALSAARCATASPPPGPPPPPPPLLPPPPLWDVPWGPRVTLATLAAVALSFAAVGSLLAPAAASALRLRPALAALGASAAAADAAALLLGDAMQAAACLALLRVASRRCLPPHACSPPAHLPWFDARWLSWPELRRLALCCVAAFPLVSLAADAAAAAAPPAASAFEAGFSSAALDPPALAAYAALVALVSPLWEESLFRGFLLPSLTAESHSGGGGGGAAAGGRHARAARAIAASALFFAASHGCAERLLPLALLGVLLGVLYVYVCPGKLMAPVLAHAAWNACTFADCLLP